METHTTVSGNDFRGSNTNDAPPLNFATATSPNSFAAVSVWITRAVHSWSDPDDLDGQVRVDRRDDGLAAGRVLGRPDQRHPGTVLMGRRAPHRHRVGAERRRST